MTSSTDVAHSIFLAVTKDTYERGVSVRMHEGSTPENFVIEYSDGEEFNIVVTKIS